MKYTPILAALLAVAVAWPVAAAEDHAQHQAADHAQLTLNNGHKWTTDEPLRAGMLQIRSTMADNLEAIHHNKLNTEQYRALATSVQQQVTTILAQCKLDPRADAVLHIIITDLLKGSDVMYGKGNAAPADGAHQVVEALNAYGTYFDHSGWRSLP